MSKQLPTSDVELKELADYASVLMGARFQKALASYRRAKASDPDAQAKHRLIYLNEALEHSRILMKSNTPSCNIPAVVEAALVKHLFELWKDHPVSRELRSMVGTPDGYVHALMLLAVCQMSQEYERQKYVLVASDEKGGRIADLKKMTDTGFDFPIELKAPKKLLQPEITLSQEEASKLVISTFKKTGSGSKRQIGHVPSGLLICGLFVKKDTRDKIIAAAKEYFEKQKPSKIAFFETCTLGLYMENVTTGSGGSLAYHPHSTCAPRLEIDNTINPYYEGHIPLVSNISQRTTSEPDDHREFTIKKS